MRFPTPLVPARLIRRYKRFLADCRLEDGREVTAHCANPGSMIGLAEPGMKIWLEPNRDPKKKLKFGWRLVDHESGHFTGVDTAVPNRVVGAALRAHRIAPLAAYRDLRAEVAYGAASRVDFLASGPGLPNAYIEVKSVTLSRIAGLAEFPDSVTLRGVRHLEELAAVARSGARAMMLYLVQRTDCTRLRLARDLDPGYAAAFAAARDAGVEALAFGCRISTDAIELADPIGIDPPE